MPLTEALSDPGTASAHASEIADASRDSVPVVAFALHHEAATAATAALDLPPRAPPSSGVSGLHAPATTAFAAFTVPSRSSSQSSNSAASATQALSALAHHETLQRFLAAHGDGRPASCLPTPVAAIFRDHQLAVIRQRERTSNAVAAAGATTTGAAAMSSGASLNTTGTGAARTTPPPDQGPLSADGTAIAGDDTATNPPSDVARPTTPQRNEDDTAAKGTTAATATDDTGQPAAGELAAPTDSGSAETNNCPKEASVAVVPKVAATTATVVPALSGTCAVSTSTTAGTATTTALAASPAARRMLLRLRQADDMFAFGCVWAELMLGRAPFCVGDFEGSGRLCDPELYFAGANSPSRARVSHLGATSSLSVCLWILVVSALACTAAKPAQSESGSGTPSSPIRLVSLHATPPSASSASALTTPADHAAAEFCNTAASSSAPAAVATTAAQVAVPLSAGGSCSGDGTTAASGGSPTRVRQQTPGSVDALASPVRPGGSRAGASTSTGAGSGGGGCDGGSSSSGASADAPAALLKPVHAACERVISQWNTVCQKE